MAMSLAGYALWSLTGALALATLLPLSKLPFGAIRGLAFPRAQMAILAALAAVFAVMMGGQLRGPAVMLGVIACVQLGYIIKFTAIWPKQSQRASSSQLADKTRQMSLLCANVKMSNRSYARLMRLIKDQDPDVAVAIEVDAEWTQALEEAFCGTYEHWVKVPQDNGYGLCLMSRLPLHDTKVRTLITENVPSIRTGLTLPSGDPVELHILHPEPPVIDHDTKGRDSEIALVGLEAQQAAVPTIVAGDLNDVAWSTTTRRFQRLSGLLDPRVGRGLYNTFHADYAIFRWPLDHLFHSAQFRLVSIKRLDHIGSDHFPIFFQLALTAQPADATPIEPATVQEEVEVRSMIRDEKQRDRAPIGEDWEKD